MDFERSGLNQTRCADLSDDATCLLLRLLLDSCAAQNRKRVDGSFSIAQFLVCASDEVGEKSTMNDDGLLNAQKSIKAQPLIAVHDVRTSSRWYTQLLGADSLPEHSHRDVYDRISCSGKLLLQLHAWDKEDHPNLINAAAAPPGHGVLLWFEVDDFDSVVERARGLSAEIIEEPHINSAPGHREMWLRDADGYVIVIASPDGECDS